jgi:hypothetical protein
VSTQFRLEPTLEGREPEEVLTGDEGVGLVLEERRIALDPGDPRSTGFVRVIAGLAEQQRPLALEVDGEGRIVRLYTPLVSPVVRITLIDRGVIGIDLAASHGRHVLRDGNPAFEELRRRLESAAASGATVLLVEDDRHDVLDVRVLDDGGTDPPIIRQPPPATLLGRLRDVWAWLIHWFTCSCSFPWGLFRAVSSNRAQQVFDVLAARTCDPLNPAAPCITFNYPDDGCWGRAHEMCRLLRAEGLRPCKVWIEGGLHVVTDNNPSCGVWWGWHVAPTHCVRGSGLFGWFKVSERVFDPALFATPVTKSQWKGVQGDVNATLTNSSWTTFYLWGTSTNNTWATLTDPSFTQTNSVLAFYRIALLNRSINNGPPPYSCP